MSDPKKGERNKGLRSKEGTWGRGDKRGNPKKTIWRGLIEDKWGGGAGIRTQQDHYCGKEKKQTFRGERARKKGTTEPLPKTPKKFGQKNLLGAKGQRRGVHTTREKQR